MVIFLERLINFYQIILRVNFFLVQQKLEGIRIRRLWKGISGLILLLSLTGMLTTFVKVHSTSTFRGYVTYYNDGGNVPQSDVYVTISDAWFNILGVTTTDKQGYYSLSVTLNGNSPYYITTTHYRWESEFRTVYSGGTYNIELDEGITEKIAVFFWASDACNTEDTIDKYIKILDKEGYTKFFKFKDSENVVADCQTIDIYERDIDTIFVYVFGHGLHDNIHGHSYTNFSITGSTIYSNEFRGYLDKWDAPRKCLLVESCYSGDWADDFAATPYLAMSSADEFHEAKYYQSWVEGDFSHWFFYGISIKKLNAVKAFYFAIDNLKNPAQNPKIQDYSSYVWFN